jgi:hypothetical protein
MRIFEEDKIIANGSSNVFGMKPVMGMKSKRLEEIL